MTTQERAAIDLEAARLEVAAIRDRWNSIGYFETGIEEEAEARIVLGIAERLLDERQKLFEWVETEYLSPMKDGKALDAHTLGVAQATVRELLGGEA